MYRILFFVFLFLIQSCKKDENKILTFKDCKVEYPFYGSGEKFLYEGHSVTNQWELESARRQLALCLCEKYGQVLIAIRFSNAKQCRDIFLGE